MFQQLEQINQRPAPFEHCTTADLWTDGHTSARMLTFHLDGSVDVSSRKTCFIDRSAEWIMSRFALDGSKRVADFGCGPGLYTTRLATSGAEVTGIDFSTRSIRYARGLAQRQGVSVDHVCADYLAFDPEKRFDLIIMIMCDFCALGPQKRRSLLARFASCLEPGGAVLFDVYSHSAFAARNEQATYAANLMEGFWSAQPYFGFLNTFKYDSENVVLDKYTIIEETRSRTIYNWLQYYDRVTLNKELAGGGLLASEVLGDVAGGQYDAAAAEFAVIARKSEK